MLFGAGKSAFKVEMGGRSDGRIVSVTAGKSSWLIFRTGIGEKTAVGGSDEEAAVNLVAGSVTRFDVSERFFVVKRLVGDLCFFGVVGMVVE